MNTNQIRPASYTAPMVRLLFCLMFFTFGYFFQAGGWNENARLDQTRAIVELKKLSVEEFAANSNDLITYEGRVLAGKAPGASFLAVPFWWFFKGFLKLFELPQFVTENMICYLVIWFTIGLVSALTAVLVYDLSESMTGNAVHSLFLTLAYAFGTIAFPFSTLFFSHQLSAFLLTGAFAVFFALKQNVPKTAREPKNGKAPGLWLPHVRSPYFLILGGFLAGYSLTTEYPNILAVVPITLYGWFTLPKKRWIGYYLAGLIFGGSFLVFYNLSAAGKIFFIAYEAYQGPQSPFPDHNLGFLGIHMPSFSTLMKITFLPQRGIFYINPWLLGILPGFFVGWRSGKNRAELGLFTAIVTAFFAMNAGFGKNIVMWGGGYSIGPRYVIPALPFAVLLVAPLLGRRLFLRILYPLCLFSVAAMLMATAIEQKIGYEYLNPLADPLWSNYLKARFAIHQFGIFSQNFLTPDSVAFNLGKLARFPGPLQLLPLFVFWFFMFRSLLKTAENRQRTPRSAEAGSLRNSPALWIVGIFLLVMFLIPCLYPLARTFQRALPLSKDQGLIGTYVEGIFETPPEPVYKALKYPKESILKRQVDASLDFDWLVKGPPFDTPFSVEWKGFLNLEQEGVYKFLLLSDDGACIYLDGHLLVETWGQHPTVSKRIDVYLNKARHSIVVRYYNHSGWADLRLLWEPPGGKLQPLTNKNLSKE